ncbi:RelA/SpoT domain-containing protein [Pseudomonas putida]
MIGEISQEAFLTQNRISEEDWIKADIQWEGLKGIGADHEKHSSHLAEYAGMLARVIQQYEGVHSVRWRVKDAQHLMEKIVRKRAEGSEKYKGLTLDNYHSIVTDLIGLRALHLFKHDALVIDRDLRESLQLISGEMPLLYRRKGDQVSEEDFPVERFEHRDHPSGYRSIHYVLQAQPQKRQIFVEVQVRTIFEEAWSEIDHKVRYPNFEANEVIEVFLTIFNRLAGQADEMGSFVTLLAKSAASHKAELETERAEKQQSLDEMGRLLTELEGKNNQHAQAQGTIAKLKGELSRMKSAAVTQRSDGVRVTDISSMLAGVASIQTNPAYMEMVAGAARLVQGDFISQVVNTIPTAVQAVKNLEVAHLAGDISPKNKK